MITLKNLKHLGLQNFKVDDFLRFLTELGPNLESLDLNGCDSEFFVKSAGSSTVQDLITRSAGSLKGLNLNNTSFRGNGLEVLCRTPELRLKELYISNCPGVSDDTVQALVETQNDLQVLDLSDCRHLKRQNIIYMLRNLMHFKTLRLGCHGKTVVKKFLPELRHLSNLTRLEINGYLNGINQSSMTALVTSYKNLTVLKLKFPGGDGIKAIQALFAHATQLRELCLDFNFHLTDAVLMGLNPEEVTPFSIRSKRGCFDQVNTSRSIVHLKRLTVLSLRWCRYFTDASLFNCFKFQELRSLNLCCCDKVS